MRNLAFRMGTGLLPILAIVGCQARPISTAALAPVVPAGQQSLGPVGSGTRQLLDLDSRGGLRVGPVIPVATTPNIEDRSAVALDQRRDSYLVAWEDLTQGNGDIFVRRVGRHGRLLGPAIAVASGSANQLRPAVAYDVRTDEYLVAWTEGTTLMARHLKASGQPDGASFVVSSAPTGFENNAKVAFGRRRGEFLVTWERAVAPNVTVLARRVSAHGGGLGSDVTLSAATGDNNNPAIAYNARRNEFFVVWSANGHAIVGRRVDADGMLDDGILPVSDPNPSQKFEPAIALNTACNQYVVVWSDGRNPPQPPLTGNSDIFGRLLRGNGTPVDGSFFVAGKSDAADAQSALAYNREADRFVLAWLRTPLAGSQLVQAIRLGPTGRPIPRTITVLNDVPTVQNQPAIASAADDDDVLVTLTDTPGASRGNTDVVGRLLDVDR